MSNITIYRGDTRPIVRNITVAGVAVDITDWTFLLTVNAQESPIDDAYQVAQSIGEITDAAGGQVSFQLDETMSATVGRFFFDIEVTDADGKKATKKGEFNVLQDITKTPLTRTFGFEYLADDEDLERTSAGIYIPVRVMDRELKGATRDSIKVLRLTNPVNFDFVNLYPIGRGAPGFVLTESGKLEIYARGYCRNAEIGVGLAKVGMITSYSYIYEGGAWGESSMKHNHGLFDPDHDPYYNSGSFATTAGWYNIRQQIDFDAPAVRFKWWKGDFDTEPSTWEKEFLSADLPVGIDMWPPMQPYAYVGVGDTVDFECDLEYWGYEVLP